MKQKNILISACLLDIPCQYDGELAKTRLNPSILSKIEEHLIPVCPEQLGGLSTPRKPVEIIKGDGFDVLKNRARVQTKDGQDFTEYFLKGAKIVAEISKIFDASIMITQNRSPSCSSNGIYDGNFNHTLISGVGVCAALLKQLNLTLIDIASFEKKFS
jgi:uncharacterized protein YbbK (DUF523 family)